MVAQKDTEVCGSKCSVVNQQVGVGRPRWEDSQEEANLKSNSERAKKELNKQGGRRVL